MALNTVRLWSRLTLLRLLSSNACDNMGMVCDMANLCTHLSIASKGLCWPRSWHLPWPGVDSAKSLYLYTMERTKDTVMVLNTANPCTRLTCTKVSIL
ncbi:hypothetical protein JCGZ_17089 [Jatropha curcas]|uniref:Secreted protein n=1 Tax=Jatropha curcas TaxID=180498 RepID=A0A067KDN3_JATCU|nr:hypothetical protein JCGZ_17089 [Jatropha curcas]